MYQEESTVKVSRERTRHVRNELKKQLSENIPADRCMNDAIQKDELEAEIRTVKTKKAPGPDGVTNDNTLPPLYQQHYRCYPKTCLQHPPCRRPRYLEFSWVHYINGYLHIPAYMETKWPISWQKREARNSSQNPNLVTKKQKRSSETRG